MGELTKVYKEGKIDPKFCKLVPQHQEFPRQRFMWIYPNLQWREHRDRVLTIISLMCSL